MIIVLWVRFSAAYIFILYVCVCERVNVLDRIELVMRQKIGFFFGSSSTFFSVSTFLSLYSSRIHFHVSFFIR